MPPIGLTLSFAQGTAFSGGVVELIVQTGAVARSVMLILAVFSLVSLGIIIYKGIVLRKAYVQSRTFLEVFREQGHRRDEHGQPHARAVL